jgi:hypothetical protein
MITLEFEGYFQMRMATDPDPSEEPRGVSGYTFALAGEPDFDGKVHFQPDEKGVHQREFGPKPGVRGVGPSVGVTVRKVTYSASESKRWPELEGARVSFVDAELKERNGILVRDDYFALDPVVVKITAAGSAKVLVERKDLLDPDRPNLPIFDAGSKELIRRQPAGFGKHSKEVAQATGLESPDDEACVLNRLERQNNLRTLQKNYARGTEAWEALETRVTQLDDLRQWWNLSQGGTPIDRRAYTLALWFYGWDIGVNGPVAVNTVNGDPSQLWPLRFWMGGWDGDALCGYVKGTWEIPSK